MEDHVKVRLPTSVDKFVRIVKQFHNRMMARVLDYAGVSDRFPVTNGVRQGCILAPTPFQGNHPRHSNPVQV